MLEIRGTFKWPEFKQLQTLEQELDYASKNLQELGRGSSRVVFLLSNRYVLKLALPAAGEKGIQQNKGEISVYTNPASKGVVTAIYDQHPNYHWLVSEIAKPITKPEEFKQLAGISWEEFVSVASNYEAAREEMTEINNGIKTWARRLQASQQEGNEALVQKQTANIEKLKQRLGTLQKTLNHPLVVGAQNLHKNANLVGGDILELDHWGKTADGRVVLIDYGFTKDLVHLYKKAAA